MHDKIKQALPSPVLRAYRGLRSTTRSRYDAFIDRQANRITGKGWLPPLGLRRLVGELRDFEQIGAQQGVLLKLLAGLQQDERLLDIGCGCGRVTLPLVGYLRPPGGYVGFDIHRPMIDWCQQHIASANENVSFVFADIRNKLYNPTGQYTASEYVFPFADASFDVIHLRSVFTHMLPEETRNYLKEISRLLTPHGRCLTTVFLLREADGAQARRGDGAGSAAWPFGNENFRYIDAQRPEVACAYAEAYLRTLLTESGLRLQRPPWYGASSGGRNYLSGQDILLLERAVPTASGSGEALLASPPC